MSKGSGGAGRSPRSAADQLTVRMTGGGSHRSNAKVRQALAQSGVRHSEGAFRAGFSTGGKSNRRVFYVHPEDVEKARKLGLTVSRNG